MAKRKRCRECGKIKGVASFHINPRGKYGIQNECRLCVHEYYIKNKAHIIKRHNDKRRGTMEGFLKSTFDNMKKRVEGRSSRDAHLWAGLPILPKEVFVEWSRNHPDFIRLFKRWTMADRDRKLAPSINRMNSDKGYTLDNMEWITHSQNCSLAGTVKSFNKRRAVYELLKDNKNG
jgi:hypothetical protein